MLHPEDLIVEPHLAESPELIKVIGVGGGGGNAVAQMCKEGIDGVRFLVCNTDCKALEDSVVSDRLQLGPGLGAGGKPEIGRKLAEENVEHIREAFDKDVRMAFITAGMGGGTGTGASPVIAREAKKLGILTIGVVTLPFLFECTPQIDKALNGLDALAAEVDALLIINNQRLCDIYPNLDILSAFKKADDILTTAVRSIVEIITMHGKVGLDFRDVYNVLKDGGIAIMSTGYAKGDGRVTKAIENALYSPLLNNKDVYDSKRLIMSITTSSKEEQVLRVEEIAEIDNFTAKFRTDVETKWGLTVDDTIGDAIKFTILASGFKFTDDKDTSVSVSEEDNEKLRRRIYNYPELKREGRKPKYRQRRHRVFVYNNVEALDNEELLEVIERVPTALRTTEQISKICALETQIFARKAAPTTFAQESGSAVSPSVGSKPAVINIAE